MIFPREQVGGCLCKLNIYFYNQQTAWVEIQSQISYVSELDQIRFLGLYISKILYHYGRNETVTALIFYIYNLVQLIMEKSIDLNNLSAINILDQGQSLIRLDDRPQKIYRSQLYGLNAIDREIDINCPTGDEDIYSPLSVRFFSQYLILNLSNQGFHTMVIYLKYLFDYFLLTGDYKRLNSSRESDLYALNSLIYSLNNNQAPPMNPM